VETGRRSTCPRRPCRWKNGHSVRTPTGSEACGVNYPQAVRWALRAARRPVLMPISGFTTAQAVAPAVARMDFRPRIPERQPERAERKHAALTAGRKISRRACATSWKVFYPAPETCRCRIATFCAAPFSIGRGRDGDLPPEPFTSHSAGRLGVTDKTPLIHAIMRCIFARLLKTQTPRQVFLNGAFCHAPLLPDGGAGPYCARCVSAADYRARLRHVNGETKRLSLSEDDRRAKRLLTPDAKSRAFEFLRILAWKILAGAVNPRRPGSI